MVDNDGLTKDPSKNLIPLRSNDERSKELQRKGGRSRSPSKVRASRMNGRVHCTSKCFDFKLCPYALESMKQKEKKKPCLLKAQTPETQTRVRDILLKGDPEVTMEMRRIIAKLGRVLENSENPKELALYHQELKNLHETLYGKQVHQKITGELKTGPTIDDFKKAMKTMKEMKA